MNRRLPPLIVCVLILLIAGGVAFAVTRPDTPQAPPAPPTATTSANPSPSATPTSASPSAAPSVPDRKSELAAVARRYAAAYQAGRTFGGEVWLAQLRPVASPELVKAVAETDPYIIPKASIETITVEQAAPDGTGLVRVAFRGDDWLLLHTAPNPAGGVWVAAVEGSKATPTP